MNGINQNIVSLTPVVSREPEKRVESSASFRSGIAAEKPAPEKEQENTAAQFEGKQVDLETLARELDKFIPDTLSDTKLRIDKDESTGKFVYKGVDPNTGEVVTQFPAENVLDAIRGFREVAGLIVDGEV